MKNTERFVSYEHGCFVLAAAGPAGSQALRQGDTLDVFEHGSFQPVTVCSGGYRGWYYVTAAGRPARFAVGMRAQNYRATCSSI